MEETVIASWFPALKPQDFKITSPKDFRYNCIGWTAADDKRWWWPQYGAYWPIPIKTPCTLRDFIDAFSHLGFRECKDGSLQSGFEKIVIYCKDDGSPTHGARQLQDGWWTSKLGREWDIRHRMPECLQGTHYGKVAVFLSRKLPKDQT